MGRLVVIALPVLLFGARGAHAHDLTLDWTAPRNCPSLAAVQEGIAARVGRAVSVGPGASVELQAHVDAVSGGYTLDLQSSSAHGHERRSLRARSCTELARASILVAALLLMDTPHVTPPANDVAGHPRTRAAESFYAYARTSLRGELGSLPNAAFGPGFTFGLAFGHTRFELGGVYLPPQTMHSVGRSTAYGSLQLMAAQAGVCQVLLTAPEVAPCLRAEAGVLSARGQNLPQVDAASAPFWLGSAGMRLGVELWRGVSWQSELAAGVPFGRTRVAVHGLPDLHHTPAVIARLETGLALRF